MLRWHFLTTLRTLTHTHTGAQGPHSHICLSRGKHLCSARQAKSVAYIGGPAAQFTCVCVCIHTCTHSSSLSCVCVFNVEIMDDNFNDNST